MPVVCYLHILSAFFSWLPQRLPYGSLNYWSSRSICTYTTSEKLKKLKTLLTPDVCATAVMHYKCPGETPKSTNSFVSHSQFLLRFTLAANSSLFLASSSKWSGVIFILPKTLLPFLQGNCMVINFLSLFLFGIQITLFQRCQSNGFSFCHFCWEAAVHLIIAPLKVACLSFMAAFRTFLSLVFSSLTRVCLKFPCIYHA